MPAFQDRDVETIGFETAEAVDDLNVRFSHDSTAHLQVKRDISFSLRPKSDLTKVLDQFVRQYAADGDAVELHLVTTSAASKRITGDLRAGLDAFRSGQKKEFERDQPRALVQAIADIRATVGSAIANMGADVVPDDIIKRMWVTLLDLDEGDCLQQAAVTLLHSNGFAPARLIWGKLVSDGVGSAKRRLTLVMGDVRAAHARFRATAQKPVVVANDDLLKVEFASTRLSVAKDVLLGRFVDSDIAENRLAMVELYRFDDDCSERITYDDRFATLGNGLKFEVIRRMATVSGVERFLESHPELITDDGIVLMPANIDDDLEVGLCAGRHRERVEQAIRDNASILKCLRCGKAVSSPVASVAEAAGEEGEILVGVIHEECVIASDRIFATAQCEFFREHDRLVNFDPNEWFRSAHGGQLAFRGADTVKQGRPILHWGGRVPAVAAGDHVVELALAEGDRKIVTHRGRVHRFSAKAAEEFASNLRAQIAEQQAKGDPFCVGKDSWMFSTRNTIQEHFGLGEPLLEVESARVRRYETRFARRFEVEGNWYAPLLYLRDLATEDPYGTNGLVIVITDPLSLARHIANWEECGLHVPQYETVSLLDDLAVDEFVEAIDLAGGALVANPVFASTETLSLVGGIVMGSLENLIALGLAGSSSG